MATIRKMKSSRYWFAVYRDAAGGQHNKSTRLECHPRAETPKERAELAAKNKRLAQDLANRLEETERGNPTEIQLRKVLSDISSRVNKERIEFATVTTFLEKWLERMEKNKSKGAFARYRTPIKEFLKSLGAKAKKSLGDITPNDAQEFFQKRLEGGRNPTTVDVDRKILNIPFALALRQGLILSNPVLAADASSTAGGRESRKEFTAQQVKDLIAAATGEWKTVIVVALYTGARLGDVVGLTWGNVDFGSHILKFRPKKTSRRSKEDLIIPMHPEMEEHLLSLPSSDDPRGPLCPKLSSEIIGGRNGLSTQFHEIMAKAKIEQETIAATGIAGRRFNKYSFHSLRHTYISMMANAGIAPDVRQLLAGHSDERSHAIYTHTQLDTLKKAIATLPGIAGPGKA